MASQTFTSSGSWAAPSNLAAPPQIQALGPGGNGASGLSATRSGGGGGGGAFGGEPSLGGVTAASTTLTITITAGSATTVTGGAVTVSANPGSNGSANTGGAGGGAGSNTQAYAGGTGGNGANGTLKGGGGGGSSAGSAAGGNNGTTATTSTGAAGGTAPTGGGNGGTGGNDTTAGSGGSVPGGGGGGGGDSTSEPGGSGGGGQVIITWTVVVYEANGYSAMPGVMATAKKTASAFKGLISVTGAPLPAQIVNQWAGTFSQPSSFQSMPPALQSTVIALDSSTSVGGGSGIPASGNWLFCIAGWNQDGITAATVGDADDIHSFWRPGNVTTSDWAVSTSTGNTRTSAWYTPNLARAPGDVYCAPNGAMAGMAVLVVEVAGLGPWDTVTGISTNYASSVTSLNLALSAPSAAAFVIGAVCGDSDAVSQAFAPGSPWLTLSTVTATNGTDHTCDAVLTSACLTSTISSISVDGTAGSATDLSGVIIGVELAAASPIPAGANPAWPGRVILEMGFGSGFETPPDEITWTVVSDNSPTWRASNKPRFWGWNDGSGVPYTLGQLQSSTGAVQLDNADGDLSPANSESPWYPDVVTGTPVRLRCALGTISGTVINRWYVLARNALEFPEKRNDAWRNYVETALTDIWSVVSASCPTPYRGEILQDGPYAWWTMDDQPLSGGVLPTTLRNSAPGNTNVLDINAASGGITAGDQYTTTGVDATAADSPPAVPPSVAVYAAGANQGWMYGDPQSSPASYATSNPVTASPGSAAWQQTGLLGSGGSNGWYLTCNDASFPALSGGMTLELWWNATFFGSATGFTSQSLARYDLTGQPYSQITLATLATGSEPVAILYLDISGHLILETFNGSSGTTHTIYNSSDLRSSSWHQVILTTNGSTWDVYLDGGLGATASGSGAGMTSAWTWIAYGADFGTSGGSSLSSATHMGNVAYSHAIVFPSVLPAWRILAHYYAAACACGLLPAPQTVALSTVSNNLAGTGYTPDGSLYNSGNTTDTIGYGIGGSGLTVVTYSFSGLVTATAGSYTSGPSARAALAGYGTDTGGVFYGQAVWLSWTGLAPSFSTYTAADAGAEEEASTVNGSGDSFSKGFGSSAVDAGVCSTGSGSGASPPAAASALGDNVGQRLERILGYGKVTYPARAIDPAPLAVQAACDVGGQQTGANCQNIVSSDNGLLTVDNNGTLCYRQKSHLASDSVIWNLSSAGPAYGYPFKSDQTFDSDPQRVWNSIQIAPYSPDGATLPVTTPSSASAVTTSQQQFGVRPLPSATSYLQSSTEIENQANWYIEQFGSLHRRVSTLTVDAAGYPPAWLFVLGCNPGDLVQVTDQPMLGGPLTVGTYRVSSVSRKIAYGANRSKVEGSVTVVCDAEPASWWS